MTFTVISMLILSKWYPSSDHSPVFLLCYPKCTSIWASEGHFDILSDLPCSRPSLLVNQTIFGFPWKPWTHLASFSFPALMYSSANPMGAIFIRHIEFKCFLPTSTPIILFQVTIISWLDCGPSLLFLLLPSTHLYFPNSNEKDAFQMKAHGDIWWFKSSHDFASHLKQSPKSFYSPLLSALHLHWSPC